MRKSAAAALALLVLLLAGGRRAPALEATAQPQARALVLQGRGRATIPLDGAWQFKTGDDLAWAAPAFDDSQWEPIEVGRPWEGQGHYDYMGFAWYRRHLQMDAATPANLGLALFLRSCDSACEVYWNGVKVGSIGNLSGHKE